MTGAALLQSVSDFGSGPFYNGSLLDSSGISFISADLSPMNPQMNKEFESSQAPGLEYLDIPSQGHDIRYDHHNTNASLTIDGTAQTAPGLINHLFHPPVLNPTTSYSPDASTYYPTHTQLYSNLDVRPRLGSTNPPPTGMSQPPRYTALPHPGSQISTRDQYSSTTPSFRRPSEHPQRSPSSFTAPLRRHPLSPTPSPITNFTHAVRMDPGQYSKAPSVPPLMPMVSLGSLQYTDGGQPGPMPIKIDIQGNIDKGFFEADGDWTCYRRNYFSCICSYSLAPWLPGSSLQFAQSGGQTYTVLGFAMCISAVVSENDSQKIELVQHTPKRDKGPTEEPRKVRLQPKPPQHQGMFPHDGGLGGPSRMGYGAADPYGAGQSGSEFQTEHTFERIQFKQATANNGKRRAAQQYYHLVIELWADVGQQAPDNFVKIAFRKSAKMIVRGRSPGHYQGERRTSTSSGPGGGSTGMQPFHGTLMNSEFGGPGGSMLSGGYGTNDYARNNAYGGAQRHQHDMALEPMVSADEAKVIDTHKNYLYYDGPISEGPPHSDGRGGAVDMFTHSSRGGHDGMLPHMSTSLDSHREGVKRDPEAGLLPSMFQQGSLSHRCSPFNGKTNTEGYYPAIMQHPGSSMT